MFLKNNKKEDVEDSMDNDGVGKEIQSPDVSRHENIKSMADMSHLM